MKKVYKMNGYTLHVIPTKKFKTITLSLRLQSELKAETTTLRTLLTFVMIAATQALPSTKELASYLDENYGARLSTNVSTKGKSQIINIYTSFIDDQYLPENTSLFEKQVDLIHDLFFNPYLIDGCFSKEIVNMKKKELKERLQMNKDDKFSYSLDKLFEYMGRSSVLGIPSTGYENKIDKITSEELFHYFNECIRLDNKHLYLVGNINERMIQYLESRLEFKQKNDEYDSAYIFESSKKEVLEIIEKQDITQSKLNMGYSIDACFINQNHYAFTVFNALFGGFSQSRLFKVVREENSLCYYISSSYDAFNGIMIVNAGIDYKDYHQTKELIKKELLDIQNGHIEADEIQIAKLMLKDSLRKTKDEASSMISLLYNRDLTHKEETNEQYIEKLMNVTKEDIVEVANKIELDTIYFLTGKEFDENNY